MVWNVNFLIYKKLLLEPLNEFQQKSAHSQGHRRSLRNGFEKLKNIPKTLDLFGCVSKLCIFSIENLRKGIVVTIVPKPILHQYLREFTSLKFSYHVAFFNKTNTVITFIKLWSKSVICSDVFYNVLRHQSKIVYDFICLS